MPESEYDWPAHVAAQVQEDWKMLAGLLLFKLAGTEELVLEWQDFEDFPVNYRLLLVGASRDPKGLRLKLASVEEAVALGFQRPN